MMLNLSTFLNPNRSPFFFLSYALIGLALGILNWSSKPQLDMPEVLGLASGGWPQECPECATQRFYHDFWPTPFFTKGVIGAVNSTALFDNNGNRFALPDGSSWPPPALRNLDYHYTYQLPADRDGDGIDEILSIYSPDQRDFPLTLRWFDLSRQEPVLSKNFDRSGLALRDLAVADLDNNRRDELILVWLKDIEGDTAETAQTIVAAYDSGFNQVWSRTINGCRLDALYHKWYNVLAVADTDGDGFKEIFVGCEHPVLEAESRSRIYAFTHDGNAFRPAIGGSDDPYLFYSSNVQGAPDLVVGDLNNDGQKEILANFVLNEGRLSIIDNQGNLRAEKKFSDNILDQNSINFPPSAVTLVNLDNSDAPEIIVSDFYAREEGAQENYYGRIYGLAPELNNGGEIVGIKSLSPNDENGLVWQSPNPLSSRSLSVTALTDNVLHPSAVLVGDVSGDGVNNLVTSWWPSDKVFAFSASESGGSMSLQTLPNWPLQLSAPNNLDPSYYTVSRNALALADIDGDGLLELLAVGHYRGPLDNGYNNDLSDDRFFVYAYDTAGRADSDLEWPVWRADFGLSADYNPPTEIPPCEDSAPSNPQLNAPENGGGNISYKVDLSWSIADWGRNCQQNQNQFTVFLDQNTNPTTVSATLPGNNLHTTVKNLKYSSIYYWRVKADNGALSAQSSTWEFNTCVPESLFPGDVTCDCSVDINDLLAIARIYGSQRGDEDYDAALDINQQPYSEGVINIGDLVLVANKYGTFCE